MFLFSSLRICDIKQYGPYFHVRATEMERETRAYGQVGSSGIAVLDFQTQFSTLIIILSSSLPADTFPKCILSVKDHLPT